MRHISPNTPLCIERIKQICDKNNGMLPRGAMKEIAEEFNVSSSHVSHLVSSMGIGIFSKPKVHYAQCEKGHTYMSDSAQCGTCRSEEVAQRHQRTCYVCGTTYRSKTWVNPKKPSPPRTYCSHACFYSRPRGKGVK